MGLQGRELRLFVSPGILYCRKQPVCMDGMFHYELHVMPSLAG
jgi:hypothetical protein